ncbi:MAG TPA: uroporphyrinogen-III C-methyltransferase [Flavitalea sp.]|nr:uroporphyrinogen-III C-methyltransferase [Flavitalea sp.]
MNKGKVIIAGAGPGDPDLLTIRAAKYLQQADVVLTDRLVSDEILKKYISVNAEIIFVGKQCRRGHSTPQEFINHLLVMHANNGKLVVRLKGGDVSLFANILDELTVLESNGIPFEIIPGVTAASGAAAYAAIPLTARGLSTAVRLLTYYKSDIVDDNYWKELAQTNDTLVFYMSAETLPDLVYQLTCNGIDPEKLMAIVQQATTPCQHVQVISLYDFDANKNNKLVSPTLVIIGKVVNLHQRFKWVENNNAGKYYFAPLTGKIKKQAVILEDVIVS